MRPGRSIANRLALFFFAVVAVAFSVIYFYVVPQLESRLERQRLADLRRVAAASANDLEAVMGTDIPARELDRLVRSVADGADAQLTLLGVRRAGPGPGLTSGFYVISDSRAGQPGALDEDLARRAAAEGDTLTDTFELGEQRLGQAAQPLRFRGRADWLALFSRPLDDVGETVGLVRTQVLVAGSIALLLALIGSYAVARAFARRLRLLDKAAAAVAAGEIVDPLPVDSEDELGVLTRTFNDMQEQLQRVDRARRDFIANASHELRTPIFSLGGFVELLEDEDLDAATRAEFLSEIREQVERLGKLAVDLLDLSRLDAGSIELAEEAVDLGELAQTVAGEFRPALSRHGSRLELRLPAGRVEARCDAARVAQIMRILLDNSLRHTPAGTLVVVAAERSNGAACVTVTDTGPGIQASPPEQIFERFFTADGARGSGLGLAIADELAHRMHGRIDLASRPGATAFTLELPTAGSEA